jgi:hypothetical protein
VLQPLGVDCQRLTLLGQRKQVHVTHRLCIIVVLCVGGGGAEGRVVSEYSDFKSSLAHRMHAHYKPLQSL